MKEKRKLSKKQPKKVTRRICGMPNPVAGMSEEEALAIAASLKDGKQNETWRTMSGEEFMEWWRKSNGQ